MKTIVISGAKSGVGKTYIAEQLLRHLSGAKCSNSLKSLFGMVNLKSRNIRRWAALKITVSKEGGCPHTKSCGTCDEIEEPFHIVKNRTIINQAGKDTSRLKRAGAKRVVWLKTRPHGLKEGLYKALSALNSYWGVIIEGTSVLKFLKPDLNIHVYSKGKYIVCR